MARRLTVAAAMIAMLVLTSVAIRMFDPVERDADSAASLRQASYEVFRQLARAQQIHQEAWRADTLTALLPDSGIVIDFGEDTDELRQLETQVTRTLASMPQRVRGGIFVVRPEDGLYTPPAVDSVYSTDAIALGLQYSDHEFYAGADERGPYCFVATTRSGTSFPRNMRAPEVPLHVIGVCRWLFHYGQPGAQLSEWLENGAYAFGAVTGVPPTDSGPLSPRNIFGGRVQEPGVLTVERLRCRTGDADACLRTLRDLPPRLSPVAAFQRNWRYGVPWRETSLFMAMEAEFGAARFERFWRSDADVETAFAAAFGVSLGEWMMQWTQRYHGVDVRGPRVDLMSVLLSLLAVGVLLGGAATVAHRRSIG